MKNVLRNKKYGFTLIELLAVIIIVSFVAIIAMPKILNIVEDSRKKAAEASALRYLTAVENYAITKNMRSNAGLNNGVYQVSSNIYEIETNATVQNAFYLNNVVKCSGKLPTTGAVFFENGKVDKAFLKIDGYDVSCENGKCSVTGKENDKVSQLTKYYNSLNMSSANVFPSYDFVQPWLFNEYSKQDINTYIKKLKRAGYNGLIFQYSMEYNVDKNYNANITSSYYDSGEIADASKLSVYESNTLKYILEAADANDFNVYIGIPYAKDWFDNKFTDASWTNAVKAFSSKTINEIYNKYNSHSSFKGWYWPFEIYSNNKNYFNYWSNLLNDTISAINGLSDSRPIMISPFVSGLYNLEINEIKNQWNSFLTNVNFRSGDIINMQDSIGSLNKSVEDIYKHIGAINEVVENSNKNLAFWINIENFDNNKNNLNAASLERYKLQIKMASSYTNKLSSFSYSHYLLDTENDKSYRNYYKSITNNSLTMISSPSGGSIYEDKNGMEVPVPKNFNVDKNNNIVKNGLVIKDSNGNEFVWIPVNGESKNNCYTYSDDEYKTVHYTRYLSNGVTCSSAVNDTLPASVSSDGAQIAKYGGFYVGRYETSYSYNNGNPRPMIKPSTNAATTFSYNYVTDASYDGYLWNNINYANAKNAAESMASLYNYDGSVKTGLINGKEWDTILRYIHINDNSNMIYDSRKWGNYNDAISPATNGNYESNVLRPSGSNENWKAKNIYDLAGNLSEWTSELSSSSSVIRSNGYDGNGQYGSATYGLAAGSYNYPNVGFRIVLYVS